MIWNIQFRPKLIDCLRDYSRRKVFSDLAAGIMVGIVALQLAMAFGIASGATPQAGIFTAVIAGFSISALGGSRVQIGGPTGAFIVIVYGIIAQYGMANLLICTVMAGVILLIMGRSGLGTVIKYIPLQVTLGFTNGIAVLILTTQIKNFFGLKLNPVPSNFFAKMEALSGSFATLNFPTVAVASGSLLLIVLWPVKWRIAVPCSIVAVILGTLVAIYFHLPVETIGSRFGNISQGLPPLHIPEVTWSRLGDLVRPATTITLLAAIESLLSAVVADGMIDDRHDSNQELMAQGVANIVCPFFGGIPATGAIARTATNIRSGAASPIAGMILAAFLFIRRVSEMTKVSLVDEANDAEGDHHSLRGKDVPPGVLVFSVFGALMFGAAEKLENILLHRRQEPNVLILRMNKVLAMDSTALNTLEHLHQKLHKRGVRLILSGPHTQPYVLMENSGFLDRLGRDNIADNVDDALVKAQETLNKKSLAA